MVLINYAAKELTAKIVYYGPGLCGKTTNLQFIYNSLSEQVKGKMLSLATKTDRTLFFDFLPLDLGEIAGMKTRIQLYTVPGQVFYNETRKLVLKGSDGIVFVADSQRHLFNANIESFKNLEENLRANGLSLRETPLVIQFNKRDLPSLTSVEDLNLALNKYNAPRYESVATMGIGVQDTLRAITKLVLISLSRKYDMKRYEEIRKMPEERITAERASEPPVVLPETRVETVREAQQAPVRPSGIAGSIRVEEPPPREIPVIRDIPIKMKEESLQEPESHGVDRSILTEEHEAEIEILDDLEEIEIEEEAASPEGIPFLESPIQEEQLEASLPENRASIRETGEAISVGKAPIEIEAIEYEKPEIPPAAIPLQEEIRMGAAPVEVSLEAAASLTPPRILGKETISFAATEEKRVELPFVVEVGKERKEFHLVISFKFEEKK